KRKFPACIASHKPTRRKKPTYKNPKRRQQPHVQIQHRKQSRKTPRPIHDRTIPTRMRKTRQRTNNPRKTNNATKQQLAQKYKNKY
ncbi:MAG: hypothetical protein FWC41_12560, partial [Firmicutes bacterium]|nr:hypothetical protein [Bacillota bacterium]